MTEPEFETLEDKRRENKPEFETLEDKQRENKPDAAAKPRKRTVKYHAHLASGRVLDLTQKEHDNLHSHNAYRDPDDHMEHQIIGIYPAAVSYEDPEEDNDE